MELNQVKVTEHHKITRVPGGWIYLDKEYKTTTFVSGDPGYTIPINSLTKTLTNTTMEELFYTYRPPQHRIGDTVWFKSNKDKEQEGIILSLVTDWVKEGDTYISKHTYAVKEFDKVYKRHVTDDQIIHNYTREERG